MSISFNSWRYSQMMWLYLPRLRPLSDLTDMIHHVPLVYLHQMTLILLPTGRWAFIQDIMAVFPLFSTGRVLHKLQRWYSSLCHPTTLFLHLYLPCTIYHIPLHKILVTSFVDNPYCILLLRRS